jgi:hypothetical protein
MTDAISAIIPAIAALAGVVLAQAWNTRTDRTRRRTEAERLLWDERRSALLRFVVSLNQALDSTRSALLEASTPREAKQIDDGRETKWNDAYECYLNVLIVFPESAAHLALGHLHAAYRWRHQAIAEAKEPPSPPSHEQVIIELQPWLSLL